MMANALRIISDSFNRSNGSLGSTETGEPWQLTRGTWSISSNAASSTDSGDSYPMATVNTNKTDITASVKTTDNGLGIAFWVTDANSWWASTTYASSSTSCDTCYQTCYQTCYETCYQTCYSCDYGLVSGSTCVDPETLQPIGPATPYNCNPYNCNPYNCNPYSCNPYSCNCVTSYSYNLRIIKSDLGTVTTPTSDISLPSSPAAMYVSTSNNTITAKAYSDTSMTTQIGSTMSYTPTSPTKGTRIGIFKSPVAYNQGTTLDDFSATV